MVPVFHHNAHDSTIQMSFKIKSSHSNDHIFGRFPFKAEKLVNENEFPEEEHLSTMWNCIVEPHGDILPLLLSPAHPDKMINHHAIPAIDFPGYWVLSGKSGVFFEYMCCVNSTNIQTMYFYGLTDNEIKVLRHRTELNKKFIIFNYMMDKGTYIALSNHPNPPSDEEAINDVNDEDDTKPPAKKVKPTPTVSHPGEPTWYHHYLSDNNEDSEYDNSYIIFNNA
jgi:hypothetical protein